MNRGIYVAASGMLAGQQWLDIASNNLANIGTNGYKREGVLFHESLEKAVDSPGANPKIVGKVDNGPDIVGTYTDFSKGNNLMTGNPLDLAIQTPEGMFAVQTPNGVKYTRDGSFMLDANSQIVNRDGYPVLSSQGSPIVAKGTKIQISEDGSVSVDQKAIGKIGLFDGQFVKNAENLYDVEGQPTLMDNGRVQVGAVEGSNVNAVDTMIEMIAVQRLYEMAQKSVQQHDESSQRLIESAAKG